MADGITLIGGFAFRRIEQSQAMSRLWAVHATLQMQGVERMSHEVVGK